MQELSEHHWGFDAAQLGFPSISACRAIVLQTTAGLFGYHMYAAHTNAAVHSAAFAAYVHGHPRWAANSGRHLYAVCYTQNPHTGYDIGRELAQWKAEAQTFAGALGFTGRRMGYSLSPAHGSNSSYVRIATLQGGMPTIKVAPWDDHASYIVHGQHTPGGDHGWRGEQKQRLIITAVNMPTPPLKQVHPQALD